MDAGTTWSGPETEQPAGPGAAPITGRSQVDEHEAWIQRNAAQVRRTLADPTVRAEVLALLDGHEWKRARRLEAIRAELADLEVHWKLEEPWED
jgi:hypothetical protein